MEVVDEDQDLKTRLALSPLRSSSPRAWLGPPRHGVVYGEYTAKRPHQS